MECENGKEWKNIKRERQEKTLKNINYILKIKKYLTSINQNIKKRIKHTKKEETKLVNKILCNWFKLLCKGKRGTGEEKEKIMM